MAVSCQSCYLWVLCMLSSIHFSVVCGLNEEGHALLSFKASITEDPDGFLANWNSSNNDPCSWNGITCKDSTVVSISIPKKRLLGSLSPDLGSLASIRHINLRNNKLLGSLPAKLFRAQGLQSLVLYGNSLSGGLPTEICDPSNLQILDLSWNLFSNSVPPSLVQCKMLKSLDLSHNNFTNSLPVDFGNSLNALERLDLSYNILNGSIPSDIGNMTKLAGTVDFSHNLFSGLIPPSIGDLPEKVYIDLAYNNLSGPIPRNGTMVNRGPNAFAGNPLLCGPPLKKSCSEGVPVNGGDNRSGKRVSMRKCVIVVIVVSDILGIALIALVFFYCYRMMISPKTKLTNENKGKAFREKECLRFTNDESKNPSENMAQSDLVPLDPNVKFNLDELLKASAIVLGKNEIGIVYKVTLASGLILAVRRLGEGGARRFKEYKQDVEAIGKVRHPNIVTLRAYYWSIEEKLLIYDYIPNGNLSTAIHGRAGANSFSPLPWAFRLKVMKGIARGLCFLHEFSPKKYVHGDLKLSNVLLGPNMEPYISDFGLAHLANIVGEPPMPHSDKMAAENPQSQHTAVSPDTRIELCYQAPEALKTQKPSQKWDVYSYGVILLELLSGRSPSVLLETSDIGLVQWIQVCIEEKKALTDVLDPALTHEPEREDEIVAVLKIALSCVQYIPETRPSMRHVMDSLDRVFTGR